MSDNFHQSVAGGTGANHIMLGHGDAIYFSDGKGNTEVPPNNVQVAAGTPNSGVVAEVENPNPVPGTNNWYTEDGYGNGSGGSTSSVGGSYVNCSDTTQPGVAAIVNYLQSLAHPINPRCLPGAYYLVNNYNPGYFGNGNNAYTDTNPDNTVFTIPPSAVPSIGDKLIAANISWKYYGDQWNNYLTANPELWSETAIMITFDEGGGYYDSGYVQPLDFFGDGTRIPGEMAWLASVTGL